MLYLLNNIEIQNKLQTIYTYVTVVLDELFAEAPAAISLLMRSTVSSVQAVSHIWTRCLFRPNFAHVSWESDFRRFYNQTNLRRDKKSEIVFAFLFWLSSSVQRRLHLDKERSITCFCPVTQTLIMDWLFQETFSAFCKVKIIISYFKRETNYFKKTE